MRSPPQEAIVSALADVKRAIPEAQLLEITPDVVGLPDIAELVGATPQNMRKLARAHKDTFHAAVNEGSAAIWHLSLVLQWLTQRSHHSIPPGLIDVAHMAMQLNLAKESRQIEVRVQREVFELVA